MPTVAVNEKGLRVGEDHQNAVLTNREVEMLLQMRELEHFGYRRLAAMFDISKAQVRRIVAGEQRCQLVVSWRVVPVRSEESEKVTP